MKSSSYRWLARRMGQVGGSRSSRTGSIIAIAGVACAVTVMLLTLGIALGFKHDIRSKLSGFEPQVSITPAYSYLTGHTDSIITLDTHLRNIIDSVLPGTTTSLSFRQPSILKTPNDFAAIVMYGYDDAHSDKFERSNIIEGNLPEYSKDDSVSNQIVISKHIATRLNLKVGDKVTACYFIANTIKARPLKIAGIYDSGFGDYDNLVVYSEIGMLQRLNKVDANTGNFIEINGLPQDSIARKAEALQDRLVIDTQERYLTEVPIVDNITHTGALYLNWLELLDTNVIVIFILMCCVSSLTLISSLFIIILDKIQAIGILRSIGATRSNVNNIFIHICMRLVGWGVLIGDIIGIGFGWIQSRCHIVGLDPEMYYLDEVPYTFEWSGIILVNVGVLILAWCVLILPTKVAGRISPAKTLRYE